MANSQPIHRARAPQFRDQNPNWQGGRTIASNGYVLVRVGVEHHLADVRGYAYEHRLVAEQKLGRRLEDGELVHHINGNKKDNRSENLEIVKGNAEHFVHHRTKDVGLRMPGEENRVIACACECGQTLSMFDDQGRPRRFITGHNSEAIIQESVLSCLSDEPIRLVKIYRPLGISKGAAWNAMERLILAGKAARVGYGLYRRTF